MRSGASVLPSVIRFGLAAASRDQALRAIVHDLYGAGALLEEEEPYRRLVEREKVQSTALGGGIAIPHARTHYCDELRLAVARLAPPVDFGASDSIPVDLVFLLLGPPEAPGEHVRLLARIARLAQKREAVEALRAARDPADFRAVVERELAAV